MAVLGLIVGLWEPQVLGHSLGAGGSGLQPPSCLGPKKTRAGVETSASPWQQGMRVKGHQLWVPGVQLTRAVLSPPLHAASAPFHLPSLLGFPKAPFQKSDLTPFLYGLGPCQGRGLSQKDQVGRGKAFWAVEGGNPAGGSKGLGEAEGGCKGPMGRVAGQGAPDTPSGKRLEV